MPEESYIEIPLRGRDGAIRGHAIIDAEDADLASYAWRLGSHGYVKRNLPRAGGKKPLIYLHREILGLTPGDGLQGDHIDRDKLDCRRANLRIVTRAQNKQNRPSQAGSSSRYRGVSWNKAERIWKAQATLDGVRYSLGSFEDELEAAAVVGAWRAANMPFTVEANGPRVVVPCVPQPEST